MSGYVYGDDGNRLSKQYDGSAAKVVWFSDETDGTTIDTDFGPLNRLARMWRQGTNTTGTKHTVYGSFEEDNIASIEVVSKTTGDAEVDSVTAQIRDGLFIARALDFVDGENVATKATATATDLAENTVSTTNTGVEIETTLDVWYEYDAAGRRTKKCEDGEYTSGDRYTEYIWNDAGFLTQVDIDYGSGKTPRYARAWLTWDPTGDLVKLEVRVGSTLESLSPGSGGTLVYQTKRTYFGGAVLVERDEVPATPAEKEYVSIGGAYLYQIDASDAYWYYHYDANGSIGAITDASKEIKALYEYDAFGNKLTDAGTVDSDLGFYGGKLLERLGLYRREGLRLYDPGSGRKVSWRGLEDPACAASLGRRNSTVLGGLAVVAIGIAVNGCSRGKHGRGYRIFPGLVVGCVGLLYMVVDAGGSPPYDGIPCGKYKPPRAGKYGSAGDRYCCQCFEVTIQEYKRTGTSGHLGGRDPHEWFDMAHEGASFTAGRGIALAIEKRGPRPAAIRYAFRRKTKEELGDTVYKCCQKYCRESLFPRFPMSGYIGFGGTDLSDNDDTSPATANFRTVTHSNRRTYLSLFEPMLMSTDVKEHPKDSDAKNWEHTIAVDTKWLRSGTGYGWNYKSANCAEFTVTDIHVESAGDAWGDNGRELGTAVRY